MVLTGDNLYVCRTQFCEADTVTIDDGKECINVRYADIEELCEHLQHLLLTRPAAQPPTGCACGAQEAEVHRPGCQVYLADPQNAGTLECTACHGKVNSLRSMPNGREMWCGVCAYWLNPPAALARPAMLEDEDV